MEEGITVDFMRGLDRTLKPNQPGDVTAWRDSENRWQYRARGRDELSPEDRQAFAYWVHAVLTELEASDDPIGCGWSPSQNFSDRWYLIAQERNDPRR